MRIIARGPFPGAIACLLGLLCAAGFFPLPAMAVDFLIPGISLSSVSLVPGASVSYLVISESFGVADSSFVELRVLRHAKGEIELEIVTGPYPLLKEDRVTVRLRLAEEILSIASGEEFRSCLKKILIREGAGDFRAPTAQELDDLDVERIFLRSSDGMERSPLDAKEVATPAGTFLCDGARISRRRTQTVRLGGVPAERIDEEAGELWTSREVPLWGLVKSRVEEKHLTKVSGAASAPASPRVTVTHSILISYTMSPTRP